jgi:hypothetical protein
MTNLPTSGTAKLNFSKAEGQIEVSERQSGVLFALRQASLRTQHQRKDIRKEWQSSSRVLKKANSPQRHGEKVRIQNRSEMPTNAYVLWSQLSRCLRVSVATLSFSAAC